MMTSSDIATTSSGKPETSRIFLSRHAPANRLFARALLIPIADHLIRGRRRRHEIRPLSGLRLSTLEIFPQRQLQAILALVLCTLSGHPPACVTVIVHGRPACLCRHPVGGPSRPQIAGNCCPNKAIATSKSNMLANCGEFG
jgi:hypothetical protein